MVLRCTTKFKDNKVNALHSIKVRAISLKIDIINEYLLTYDNFIERKCWIAFYHCIAGICYIVHNDLLKLIIKLNWFLSFSLNLTIVRTKEKHKRNCKSMSLCQTIAIGVSNIGCINTQFACLCRFVLCTHQNSGHLSSIQLKSLPNPNSTSKILLHLRF